MGMRTEVDVHSRLAPKEDEEEEETECCMSFPVSFSLVYLFSTRYE